jgi:hypothetical protein
MSQFQYQALAEPVLVSAPAATIYLDWQVQEGGRIKKRRFSDHQAFTAIYVTSTLPINADLVISTPAAPTRRRQSYLDASVLAEPFIAAITTPPRVRVKFKFPHSEAIQDKQSRLHEQTVAKWLNRMIEEGELQGTPINPSLGYQCDDPAAWNTVAPASLKEAVDRIAAALKALMGGIP